MDGIVNEDKMSKNLYNGGEIILKALSDQDVDDELFAKLREDETHPHILVRYRHRRTLTQTVAEGSQFLQICLRV